MLQLLAPVALVAGNADTLDPTWGAYKEQCADLIIPGFDAFITHGSNWQKSVIQYKLDMKKFTQFTCEQYLNSGSNGEKNLASFLEAQKPIIKNLRPIESKAVMFAAYITTSYEELEKKWKELGIRFSRLTCGNTMKTALKNIQTEKIAIQAQAEELKKCVAVASAKPSGSGQEIKASAFQPQAPTAQSAKGLDVKHSDISENTAAKRAPASTTQTK